MGPSAPAAGRTMTRHQSLRACENPAGACTKHGLANSKKSLLNQKCVKNSVSVTLRMKLEEGDVVEVLSELNGNFRLRAASPR